MECKIWLLTALSKLAQSILCLTVQPIPSQGDFCGFLQKIHMLHRWWNLACGGKEMWWHTPSFLKYITRCMVHWSAWHTRFHWLHHIVIIFSKVQENDTLCLCYFFFPVWDAELGSLWWTSVLKGCQHCTPATQWYYPHQLCVSIVLFCRCFPAGCMTSHHQSLIL